jgi:broad specificity phosphatase PhoE
MRPPAGPRERALRHTGCVPAPQPSLVLVRHGETEWSRANRHTGHSDIPLTEEGRRQAETLRAALAVHRFDAVLASPLSRALETCRLAGFGDRAEVCEDLREWDYGIYEGRTAEQIRRDEPGWTIWSSPVPKGENLQAVAARAERAIDTVRDRGRSVLVFAHGHLLRILAARWCDFPAEAAERLMLWTARISVLGYDRGLPVMQRWNQAPEKVVAPSS